MAQQDALLFLDMLGFADLVDEHEGDPRLRPYFPVIEGHPLGEEERFNSGPGALLSRRFYAFHRVLEEFNLGPMRQHETTHITFSDSAFIVQSNLADCVSSAIALMRNMLFAELPVRMGIGVGSFAGLRFSTDVSHRGRVTASQFLGSGVVRAHRAEACGLRGMRIFVHPSADNIDLDQRLVVPITVGVTKNVPKYGITKEINFLFKSIFSQLDGPLLGDTKHPQNQAMFDAVAKMRREAPQQFAPYYDDTHAAMNQMYGQYGYDPLVETEG